MSANAHVGNISATGKANRINQPVGRWGVRAGNQSFSFVRNCIRARSEPGGTRWRTGGEVKGKLANGVGSQYSHAASERGVSNITQADAHTSTASSRLNWRSQRFKWTRPFRGKTKSGFCAWAITFRTSYTNALQCYIIRASPVLS